MFPWLPAWVPAPRDTASGTSPSSRRVHVDADARLVLSEWGPAISGPHSSLSSEFSIGGEVMGQPTLMKRSISELIGTDGLVFLGTGAVVTTVLIFQVWEHYPA